MTYSLYLLIMGKTIWVIIIKFVYVFTPIKSDGYQEVLDGVDKHNNQLKVKIQRSIIGCLIL